MKLIIEVTDSPFKRDEQGNPQVYVKARLESWDNYDRSCQERILDDQFQALQIARLGEAAAIAEEAIRRYYSSGEAYRWKISKHSETLAATT